MMSMMNTHGGSFIEYTHSMPKILTIHTACSRHSNHKHTAPRAKESPRHLCPPSTIKECTHLLCARLRAANVWLTNSALVIMWLWDAMSALERFSSVNEHTGLHTPDTAAAADVNDADDAADDINDDDVNDAEDVEDVNDDNNDIDDDDVDDDVDNAVDDAVDDAVDGAVRTDS